MASFERLLSGVKTAQVHSLGSHLQHPLPPLLHSSTLPRCTLWLRHSSKQPHSQTVSVHGPQFSPQRVDPTPSSTFQLDRTEGEAECDANNLCIKPRLSLSQCAHAGYFTQFHISFPLIHLFFFPSAFSFFEWESISADFSILSPPRAKGGWGWSENRKRKDKKCQKLISFEQGVKCTACSPPASCGFSLWPWRMVCACVKLKLTISEYRMVYWSKERDGITCIDYVHVRRHTHTADSSEWQPKTLQGGSRQSALTINVMALYKLNSTCLLCHFVLFFPVAW